MIKQKLQPTKTILNSTRVIINNVCNGLAMGSPLSSSLAYFSLDHLETNHILSEKILFHCKLFLWQSRFPPIVFHLIHFCRYIECCCTIRSHRERAKHLCLLVKWEKIEWIQTRVVYITRSYLQHPGSQLW